MPEPKKPTYWERWAITRQSGWITHMIRSGIRFFILLLFLQVCYQLAVQNYSFQFQWLFVPAALGLSLLSWLIQEYLYKLKAGHTGASPKP